jgi:hypothetical protein
MKKFVFILAALVTLAGSLAASQALADHHNPCCGPKASCCSKTAPCCK